MKEKCLMEKARLSSEMTEQKLETLMKESHEGYFWGIAENSKSAYPAGQGCDAIGWSGRLKCFTTIADEDWLQMAYDHSGSADTYELDPEFTACCAIMEALRGGAHAEL